MHSDCVLFHLGVRTCISLFAEEGKGILILIAIFASVKKSKPSSTGIALASAVEREKSSTFTPALASVERNSF
jgi:hypothetical protein